MGKKPLFIGGGVLAVALVVTLIMVLSRGDKPNGSGEPDNKPTGTFAKTGLLFQSGRSGKTVFVERFAPSGSEKPSAWFTVRDGSKVDPAKHLNQVVQITGSEYKGNELLVESVTVSDKPMGEVELYEASRLLFRDEAYESASVLCERFAKEHDTSDRVFKVYQRWCLAKRERQDYQGALAVCERYQKTYPFDRKGIEAFQKRIASIQLNYIDNPEWGIYRSRRAEFATMKPEALRKHLDTLRKAYRQTANVPGADETRAELLRLVAKAGDVAFLAERAKNGDEQERLMAAQQIGKLKDSDTTRTAMMNALDSSDANLRLKAVEYLGETKHAPAVAKLATLLKSDPSPRVRAEAADRLGQIGGDEAVAALKASVAAPQKEVRRGVIFGLARAGRKDVLRNRLSQESDPELKKLIEANVK